MPRRVLAHVPLAHGLDTKLDERLRSPGQLSELTNAYFPPGGRSAAAKRHGFTAMATAVNDEAGRPDNQGPPSALFSTGAELCIRGYRSLYTWNSTEAEWFNRGPLSPMVGTQATIWQDNRSVYAVDSYVSGNYVGHVAVMRRQTDAPAADKDTAIVFRATTLDGHVLIPETTLDGPDADPTSGKTNLHACRAASCDGKILVSWQEEVVSPGTLRIWAYATSSPTTAPVSAVTHTDLYEPEGSDAGRATHDIAPASGGRYCYAYISNENPAAPTNNIQVFLRNSAHGEIAHVALSDTAPYQSVGIAYDEETDRIYVVASSMKTDERCVELWCLHPTTLATVWGPISLTTFSNDETATYCAVTGKLPSDVGFQRITAVWGREDTSTAGRTDSKGQVAAAGVWIFESRSTNTAGADLDTLLTVYNAWPASKPWFERDRCYAAAVPIATPAFGGASILDLAPGVGSAATPGTRRIDVAAVYNFGTCTTGIATSLAGPMAVWETAADSRVWRFSAQAIAYDSAATGEPIRLSADSLSCDFNGAALVQAATRGAAILGGGAVYWYAGVATEELGFLVAPHITDLVSSNNGGSLSASTAYQYLACWETWDENGTLLRSIPGPVSTITTGMGHNAVDVTALALQLTSRFDARRVGLVVYRAETDGEFERASGAIHVLDNVEDSPFVDVFRDLGNVNDAAVYTQGAGELEAATPNGASVVTVGASRVLLGGFWKADRVQWSKGSSPGTATENAIAPEFNELFTYLLSRGKRCTGLAEIDDKWVVFTPDEIYVLAGNGPNDAGAQNDFSGLTALTTDAGCTEPRSVAVCPAGVLFRSKAGIYLLGRDLQLAFVGEGVMGELASTGEITSAVLVPTSTHVRFTVRDDAGGPTGILVFDYGVGAWSKWEPRKNGAEEIEALDLVGACVHDDVYHLLEADGTVWREDSSTWLDDGDVYIPMVVESSPVQSAQPNGWQRVCNVVALCARKDHHDLTVTLYCDFETTAADTYTWTQAIIATFPDPDAREQVRFHVRRQKSTAIKVRIEDAASAGTTTGEGYTCAGLSLELLPKQGVRKAGSAAQN